MRLLVNSNPNTSAVMAAGAAYLAEVLPANHCLGLLCHLAGAAYLAEVLPAAHPASEFFCDEILHRSILKRHLGKQALELGIL